MLKILVVDDHPVVRQGLKQIIEKTSDIEVAGEANSGKEAIKAIAHNDYDLVLLDISMPGNDGIDVLKEIKKLKPSLAVLILTIHPESLFASRMLNAGASGYLTKEKAPNELIEAIRIVANGEKYITSDASMNILSYLEGEDVQFPHNLLSRRELQIMKMLASGKTVKEISKELVLSEKTVSCHRANILNKMKMKNVIELTRYAIKNCLIDW